jgi:hypothetical protein
MLKQDNSKMDSLSNLTINNRKLVVGIHFGTTFSGAAWAETRRVGKSKKKVPEGTSILKIHSLIISP